MPTSSSVSWKWKLWLLNMMAVVYFLALSLGSLAIGILVTLPELYSDDPSTLHSRQLAAVYVFIVLMLNYVCLRYYSRHSNVRSDHRPLPRTMAEEEMRICQTCDVTMPPRTKHCPLCNACVLKRDHHCFFGGCCVGFHNQRYFIMFCLYGTLGSLYSTFVTFTYLSMNYSNILSWDFYTFLLPWLMWFWYTGYANIGIVAMVIFSYFCVLTVVACSYFLGTQCFLLVRGQTSYEYVKGIKRYRCSLRESLSSVFGPLWFLNLIVPLPFLKSADNGFDWKVVHDFKQM